MDTHTDHDSPSSTGDRDIVDIATGRIFASKVYNSGRVSLHGND